MRVGGVLGDQRAVVAELLGDAQLRQQTARYNFVYRADGGRTASSCRGEATTRIMPTACR